MFGGAPVYPTVVVRTPGCFRRDSAGSQKHLYVIFVTFGCGVRIERGNIIQT